MTLQELNDIKTNFYNGIEGFTQTWPLSRVQNMTLQEYTNLNRSDSFCYWLEAKTYWSGSIWGGSAFKFGIYEKNNKATQFSAQGRMSDANYAWMSKYGNSREEAFEKVRSIIVQIIQLSQAEQFEGIGKLDLGDAVKWKIAFMYSDFKLFTVYKKEKLVELASKLNIPLNKSASFYELQKAILASKPADKDFLDFYMEMLTLLEPAKNEIQYWIYSPGEQAFKWEEFYKQGIMALGWDDLKPLDEYASKDEITEDLRNAYGGEGSKKNDTAANDDFANKMKIGDVVFVKKGRSTLLGFGAVESDYYFDDQRDDYKHCRKVKWEKKGNWIVDDHSLVLKTLTDITGYLSEIAKGKKYYEFLLDKMTDTTAVTSESPEASLLRYKKQIILQGPPGTGKTREAKLIAKEMLRLQDVKDLANNDQFKLIQFHPSYTYEDFVRGIVAESKGEKIEYKNVNKTLGLFAEKALNNFRDSKKDSKIISKEIRIKNAFEDFKEFINDEIEKSAGFFSLTDSVGLITTDDNEAFRYKGKNEGWLKNGNRMLFKDILQAYSDGNTERQDLKKNLLVSGLARQHASYFIRVLNLFQEFIKKEKIVIESESNDEKIELKNFVLIIDEINRANLSSVLGELIYALEYREKAVESMYAVDDSILQNKNQIILPPNLFIIGTMNTADRSVGHIDYAIRRRFAFVYVLPENLKETQGLESFDDELFLKVAELFDTNLSNEFKKSDVQLGHSYFIDKSEEGGPMGIRFEYEIKPILLEYVKDGILVGSVKVTEGGQVKEISVEEYIHSLS